MARQRRAPEAPRAVAGLVVERVALAALEEDPENANTHPERNIEAIKASLAEFGQVLPLVVKGGWVIGGNGTLRAMRALGWTEADITRVDHLTDVQAKALAIALNRTAQLAKWDEATLQRSLQELATFRVDMPAMLGFDQTEMKGLAKSVARMQAVAVETGNVAPDEVPAGTYTQQYGVIVVCQDEGHQQETYEALRAQGLNCRVVTT